jgi:hypothetical protein
MDLSPWIFRAMSMENVVLGNHASGRDEIVTPEIGFLRSENMDSHMYFAQIQDTINHRDKLERMKKLARDMVLHMNLSDMMESYVNLLVEK